MRTFLLYLSLFGVVSCIDNPQESIPVDNTNKSQYDSIDLKYKKVIEGLKVDYVLYYRLHKKIGHDSILLGMSKNDSAYLKDSVRYWESYRRFFLQDKSFINWLLAFKNDTVSHGLWHKYRYPYSSHLSECDLSTLRNSRAAIILLENFLGGYKEYGHLICFECDYKNHDSCNTDKYAQVEAFIKKNNDKDIEELRKAWQTQNYR